jgi:hypothetical protein
MFFTHLFREKRSIQSRLLLLASVQLCLLRLSEASVDAPEEVPKPKKSIVVIICHFGGGLIFLSKFFDHPPFGYFVVEAAYNRSL